MKMINGVDRDIIKKAIFSRVDEAYYSPLLVKKHSKDLVISFAADFIASKVMDSNFCFEREAELVSFIISSNRSLDEILDECGFFLEPDMEVYLNEAVNRYRAKQKLELEIKITNNNKKVAI